MWSEDDFYKKQEYGSQNRPENYEFYVMNKLKTLVDDKNTPHITYPISFFHCKNSEYPFINENIGELLEGGTAKQSSVLISEWAIKVH